MFTATALTVGVLSSTPNAAAADPSTGSLSGTVTSSSSSEAVSGVSVTAYGPSYGTTTTGVDGTYTFSGLNPGEYRLEFNSFPQNFVTQFWGGASTYNSATYITVAAAATVTGIDVELVDGATISGNVKGAGEPPVNLASVQVYAYPEFDSGLQPAEASTDSDGNFTLIGLAEGDYQLHYDTQSVRNYAPAVGESFISLGQGEDVSGIQMTLAAGGTIGGFISSELAPLEGVEGVTFSVWSVVPTPVMYFLPWFETTSDGEYALEGLPAGTFNVRFTAPSDPGSNLLDQTAQLTVTPGGVTTHDVVLVEGGSVTGTVTASGVPVEGIGVSISAGNGFWAGDVTDDLGNYTITKLPTGSYPVRFTDTDTSPTALATEWWPNSFTKAGATAVAVTAGAVTTGIDVDLATGSTISGDVTFGSGDLTATASLYVWDANGDLFGGDWEYLYLGTDRSYVIGGLPAGDYKIGVTDKTFGDGSPDGVSDNYDELGNLVGWEFNPGYADVKDSLAAADLITIVGPDEHLTGHDIHLTVKTDANEFSVAPVPTISGNPEVGEVLTITAATSDWVPDAIFLAIRWFKDGIPIPFATNSDYQVQPDDFGHHISASVTASRIGYEELERVAEPLLIVAGGLDFVTAQPTITGTPQVGHILTAETTTPWDPQPTAITYQWLSDGNEIEGATASTYEVTSTDLGSRISVEVTGTKPGYTSASASSAETSAVAGGLLDISTPTFSPTSPAVGDTLTADAEGWGPSPVALSYQWKRNGIDISGARDQEYVVVLADLNTQLSVRVVGVKAAYVAGIENSASSSPVVKGTIVPGTLTVDGTARVGLELSANLGTWTPASGITFGYQWKANGAPIAGATSPTYTLTATELGKTISITVTGVKAGFDSNSTTSLGTGEVINEAGQPTRLWGGKSLRDCGECFEAV